MTTLTAPLPITPLHVGGMTLGERLDHEWSELHAHGRAACPVCGESMELSGDAGLCGGCGSWLQ